MLTCGAPCANFNTTDATKTIQRIIREYLKNLFMTLVCTWVSNYMEEKVAANHGWYFQDSYSDGNIHYYKRQRHKSRRLHFPSYIIFDFIQHPHWRYGRICIQLTRTGVAIQKCETTTVLGANPLPPTFKMVFPKTAISQKNIGADLIAQREISPCPRNNHPPALPRQ